MKFNLIDEQWIPAKRRDGSTGKIAPHEVTKDFADNPIISLDAPRPDFNGALIQFLIGLMQTVAASKNGAEWRKKLAEPPAPDELKERFSTIRHAFELGGDGPRFMQDFEDIPSDDGVIDGILIETPGQNALVNNTDDFIKRNLIGGICPACCATALFAFQTNSPSGGPGYMTSLRGGGPLTTLVLGDGQHNTLWQLVWLNVLEESKFMASCGNPGLTEDRLVFPWLGLTKNGKRKKGEIFYGEDTQPEHAHPATMFWAMPRRIKLNCTSLVSGTCGVCGCDSDSLIMSYKEIPGGASYTGWLHPLSPYYEKTTKGVTSVLPVHAQPGGISYRHWLGLVIQDGNEKKMPARIVHEFYERWKSGWQFRLWAFGYDMDNMKARCWYESTMPLLCIDDRIRGEYERIIGGLIRAASEIASNTRTALKKAWFKRPGDAKGDTSFVDSSFWQNTEADFYKTIEALNILESEGDTQKINNQWLSDLCKQSSHLFDRYAWDGPIEDADPKRVVIARKELEQFNRGKKIKELLGIPVKKASKGKKIKSGKEPKQRELPI
ncbi:MAG: type I-E CRISPR-associated protein Cse1/CasA [Thermodesulfobacteriota bacterium]